MRRFCTYNWIKVLSVLVLVCVTQCVFAVDERYAAPPMQGNRLRKDSTSIVIDTVYANASLKPYQQSFTVRNLITFKLNEFANIRIPDTFRVIISFKVYYTRNAGGTAVQDSTSVITLDLDIKKQNPYPNKAIYTFFGGHRAEVKITSISVTNTTLAAIENSLMLENEILVNREYNFSCTNNAVQTVNKEDSTVTTKGELIVNWAPERAADEYDLEWAYIDQEALTNYKLASDTTQYDPKKVFGNNATRVSLKQTLYLVPLLYDNNGTLFFRVRPVQVKQGGQRIEANWSSDYTNGLGQYAFGGHENLLNWQATTSFAEDGKRKSVVQYYDGSLRGRQTVTKDNTTDTTIVAESLYDYQGRPVIQVLPTPSLSRAIKYTPNFNSVNSGEYAKNLYDGLLADSCYCTVGAPAMTTANGAAQYYSANNPNINNSYHQYIPRADSFPFAETRYTPDNTGRIALQSGVGPDFQIGKADANGFTHETRYYYSGADQEELDALFGTEVGKASHYFKNMVRDANGQFSVSYVDMHGRTVATALAGKPFAKLDTLESNKKITITKRLLDSANNIVKDLSIVADKSLMVTRASDHQFKYSLQPDSIRIRACDSVDICYDCLYDLEITITDDCNNSTLPNNQPLVIRRSNLHYSIVCDTMSFPSVDTTIFLREGSYQVSKKLTISKQGMEYFRDSIFIPRNTCKNVDSFIARQKALLPVSSCVPVCDSCLVALGSWASFQAQYMTDYGIAPADSADYRQQALRSFEERRDYCAELCDGFRPMHKSIREQMLADLTPPFGQYANDRIDEYSIFKEVHANSGIWAYQRGVDYLDANDKPDLVKIDNESLKRPDELSPEQFKAYFKPIWAEALLPKHPEYCKLEQYEKLATSHIWDEKFEKVATFKTAVDSGYLNPGNFSNRPAGSIFDFNTARQDPFFTALKDNGTVSSFYKNMMQDSLRFRMLLANGDTVSMWSMATIMAHCKSGDTACMRQFGHNNTAFGLDSACSGELDIAWQYFRGMYLQEKREVIAKWLEEKCPNDRPSADHFVHFPDFSQMPADAPVDEQSARDSMQVFIDSNCYAYASQWWQEMKPCNFSQLDSAAIISRLVQVCREGGDKDHMFGARTVKPSSTNTDRSFEQVIKEYAGANYNSTCNVYLITAPKRYDQPVIYAEKPLLQKPDSCECSLISDYYGKFQVYGQTDTTFSKYLLRTTGTYLRDGALDTLRRACKGEINCSFLKKAISLPTVFQCGFKDLCVPCLAIDTLYANFQEDFPGVTPSYADVDSLQRVHNKLFTTYINDHLGFGKSTAELLDFIDTCSTYNKPKLRDTLTQLVRDFKAGWGSAPGCADGFVNYYNTQRGTALTENQINNIYAVALVPQIACTTEPLTCDSLNKIYSQFLCIWNTMDDDHINRGYCDETGWSRGGIVNGVYTIQNKLSTNAPGVSNGTYKMIDDTTIKMVYLGRFAFYNQHYYINSNFDAQNNLSFEFMVRAPSYDANGNRTPNYIYLIQDYGGTTGGEAFSFRFSEGGDGQYSVSTNVTYVPQMSYKDFSTWHKVKYHVEDSFFRIYYDDTLVVSHARTIGAGNVAQADGLAVQFYNAAWAELDWVKFYRRDTVFYYDEFDGPPGNPFGYPDPTYILPRRACDAMWARYFNSYTGKSYTFDQVNAYYKMRCGYSTAPCPDKVAPTLCGKLAPVAAPFKQYNSCDDSTLFATAKGTQLYEYYRDSLNAVFEDRYKAKCLAARFKENFTVVQPVSEYHYTLYYYDLAGNLVKTVPPAGVNTGKFAWSLNWSDSVKTARSNKQVLTPVHSLPTNYRYNTLNQVVAQHSPDGGKSEFWYDRLGRLAISRNAKQYWAGSSDDNNRLYSYIKYDALGRITEVGQVKNTNTNGAISDNITRNETSLNGWLLALNNRREQVTTTVYDIPYAGYIGTVADLRLIIQQRNLRNRVSYVTYADVGGSNFNQATMYTYDIHGNVDTLLQDYGLSTAWPNIMNKNGNRYKKITYKYDLISGKVNMVMYQRGWSDQFYHRYSYDAENRLTQVETSTDSLIWERDAQYAYYQHGPLARTVIGEQSVQGLDYAYTLQGWLKGINSTGAASAHDMGGDAKSGNLNQYTGKDAIGVTLNYFTGEYKPINAGVTPFPGYSATLGSSNYRPLYNGNISSMSTYFSAFESTYPILFNNFQYDQLNRITGQDVYTGFNTGTNSWSLSFPGDSMYRERYQYDANGNIQKLKRYGAGFQACMDNLVYSYYPGTNQLRRVRDSIDANKYGANSWDLIRDIDDQTYADNYQYDSIGNLIRDSSEKIWKIEWTVYGKIKEINRYTSAFNNVTKISYSYDVQGNRIGKIVQRQGIAAKEYTWYVRDGQGNVMAMYRDTTSREDTLGIMNVIMEERHIYGSSRLGVNRQSNAVDNNNTGPSTMQFYNTQIFYRGNRQYELTNHLGNVLTVVSDKKWGVYSGGIGSLISYYKPDIKAADDYYPFGMVSRHSGDTSYRYGFNGKEYDSEAKQWRNQQDYGMRIYDPRLGRFLSVDPLTAEYPWNSTYAFAENDVIRSVDLDGAEKDVSTFQYSKAKFSGQTVLKIWDDTYRGDYIGYKPTTIKEKIAIGFVGSNNLPANGKFTFFQFAPELGISDYARYEYSDPGGKQFVRYFDAEYLDFMYTQFDIAVDLHNKKMAKVGAVFNLLGAGLLWKTELKAAAGELKATTSSTQSTLNGKWVPENTAGWSKATIEYQEHVTGVKAGSAYKVGDVKFDGVRGGTLLEAKGAYDNFIDAKTGQFKGWFLKSKTGAPALLDQAQRQITAANGAPIEWNFSSQRTLNATKSYLESQGVTGGINYKLNPKP